MSALLAVAVGVGGSAGALLRFTLDGQVSRLVGGALPVGTFVVNTTGALLLGVLVGLSPSSDLSRVAGTGILGGYTTFSTWMFESQRLGEDGGLWWGFVNLGLSLLVGLAGVALGRQIGGAL